METGIIKKPILHIYNEINIGKFKGTKHYELVEVGNGNQILSDLINISEDRGFAKVNPCYWLKTRNNNKWEILTGIFKTSFENIYHADKRNGNYKEDLILIRFSDTQTSLLVYYFKNYYTTDINKVIRYINGK